MVVEEHLRILAAKLKGARLNASGQRKLNKAQQKSWATAGAKRHQPLTQAFVARELGISQSFLSKLEKGQQEPNFLLVELLARYYGVKLSAFSTYTPDEIQHGHHLND